MDAEIKGTQKLYLWSLFGKGGEAFVCELPVPLQAPDRKTLHKVGLVEAEKRKRPETGRPANYEMLTDRGWAWASEHLHDPIDSRSTKGGQVLSLILARLGNFLDGRGLVVADLFVPGVETPDEPGVEPVCSEERVRQAILDLGGGFGRQVRLSHLRVALPDIPRLDLDDTLHRLQSAGQALLIGLSNPADRTPADEAASIELLGVGKRHLVILER